MNSVEEAYQLLGRYLISFAGERPWDECTCQMVVYNRDASAKQWLQSAGQVETAGGFETDSDAIWAGLDAAVFLRDEMLRVTGHRIWGLTFTLYPSGKFKLDYDYSKPEGYDETGEAIDLSDAVSQLKELGAEVQVKGGRPD